MKVKAFIKKYLSLILVLIGIACGTGFGFIAKTFSSDTQSYICNNVFSLISGIFVKVIGYLSGPLIFISVVTSIFNMKTVKTFLTSGRKLLVSIFVILYLSSCVSLLVGVFGYNINFSWHVKGNGDAKELFSLFKAFIPKDIISPFLDINLVQVIILAIIFGFILLIIGKEAKWFVKMLIKVNDFLTKSIKLLAYFIPVYVFCAISSLIITNEISKYSSLYIAVLFTFINTVIVVLTMILLSSLHLKVSPLKIVKHSLPSFIVATTTGCSTMAIPKHFEAAKANGINKNEANFGVPLANSFFKCISVVYLSSLSLYFFSLEGRSISFSWLSIAAFIITILAITVAPVPGGGINTYKMMIAQFSIAPSALGILVALDPVADLCITGINNFLQPMEIANVAKKNKKMNMNVIREKKVVLVTAAMDVECLELMSRLDNKIYSEIEGYMFCRGKINNKEVIVLQTNIGTKNAKKSTEAAIKFFSPSLVISMGTSGGHNLKVHKGDIIVSKNIINYDDPMSIKLTKDGSFVDQFLSIPNSKAGTILTSDVWHQKESEINKIHKHTGSDCEEMESFLTCYAAEEDNIDNIAIRIISNNHLLKEDYDRNLGIELQDKIYNYLKATL